MNTIRADELKSLLQSGKVKLLLDVRTPLEYRNAHVKGAINIPLADLDSDFCRKTITSSTSREVYLICKSGARANQAQALMSDPHFWAAYKNNGEAPSLPTLLCIEGGTDAARANGIELAECATKTISLERQVRIAAGAIVLAGSLLGLTVSKIFFIVPIFVGCGLMFAGITDWCGMGLLLARMPWNGQQFYQNKDTSICQRK